MDIIEFVDCVEEPKYFTFTGEYSNALLIASSSDSIYINDKLASDADALSLLRKGVNKVSSSSPSAKLILTNGPYLSKWRVETVRKEGLWYLELFLELYGTREEEKSLTLFFSATPYELSFALKRGLNRLKTRIKIDQSYGLWYPNDHGPQHLYEAILAFEGERSERMVGFRSLSVVDKELFVNSIPLFVKGAVIDSSSPLGKRESRFITESAKVSHMNLLRIKGDKCLSEELLDGADRLGLFVVVDNPPLELLSHPSLLGKELFDQILLDQSCYAKDISLEDLLRDFKNNRRLDEEYLAEVQRANNVNERVKYLRTKAEECKGIIFSALYSGEDGDCLAAIERDGRWRLLQYSSKRFYAPLVPIIYKEDGRLKAFVSNDTSSAQSVELKLRLYDFSGAKKETFIFSLDVPANSTTKVFEKSLAKIDIHKSFVEAKLKTKDIHRDRTLLLALPKDCLLESPSIKAEVKQLSSDKYNVRLSSDRPAFWVSLDTPGIKTIFSDNCFALIPGKEKNLIMTCYSTTDIDQVRASLKVNNIYLASF